MTKIREVSMQKHDTCYTYALKRVGIPIDTYDSSEFLESCELTPLINFTDLDKGDLLIYFYPQDKTFLSLPFQA